MFRKIAKDLNKIYHLFAKIPHIITILENPSKNVLSDSKESVSYASTLVNLDALSQLYQKTLHRGVFFFLSLANFLRIGTKINSS